MSELYRPKQDEAQAAIDARQDEQEVHAFYHLTAASTSGINLPVGSSDIMDCNVKIKDTHDAVTVGSDWKFTVPEGKGGLYRAEGSFLVSDSGVGFAAFIILYIRVNGNIVLQRTVGWATGTPFPHAIGGKDIQLVPGDEVQFEWYQSGGPSRVIEQGIEKTYVTVSRIGN